MYNENKKRIYIATYAEDGEPCVSSFTKDGLQRSLDDWNGFGTNPNVSILDKKEHVYKYGGESLIETIIYKDSSSYQDEQITKYHIWNINID